MPILAAEVDALNSDTASGSTMPPVAVCTPRPGTLSIIAGSDASDDWVPSATSCAGAAARMKAAGPIRPTTTARIVIASVSVRFTADSVST
jgi:hypothetical protein